MSSRANKSFVGGSIGFAVLLLLGWVAVIISQPACGPPGNTEAAAVDRWLPWALITLVVVGPGFAGLAMRRSPAMVFWTIVLVGAAATFCGGATDLLIAAGANCFA